MIRTMESCTGHFSYCIVSFFFNDTASTDIYTLSLHDALPILLAPGDPGEGHVGRDRAVHEADHGQAAELFQLRDRKSTRLNSSHSQISYAVFCLKKKIFP